MKTNSVQQKADLVRQYIKNKTDGGKFFSIVFTKKDNTEREMVARLGVTSHLRGGVSTTKHLGHLLTVYDVQSKGYRNINLETVKRVKIGGTVKEF